MVEIINKIFKDRIMKKIYIFLLLTSGLFFSACVLEDTTGDVSRVTIFPTITLNGSELLFVTMGDTYADEGAVSTVGETEIETTTTYTDGLYAGSAGVDTSKADKYFVQYSAENEDGFSGSALRTVWVVPPTGDLVTSIEGLYTIDVQRAPTFTPSAQYDDLEYVFIWKISANTYGISGAIGGYYDLGRGYGPAYAATGATIIANDIAANDFSYTGAFINGFGLAIDISAFTVDAAEQSITYTGSGSFGNGTFKVQLTQVQF